MVDLRGAMDIVLGRYMPDPSSEKPGSPAYRVENGDIIVRVENLRDATFYLWQGGPVRGEKFAVVTEGPELNLTRHPLVPSFGDGDWVCCRALFLWACRTSEEYCSIYYAADEDACHSPLTVCCPRCGLGGGGTVEIMTSKFPHL